MDVKALPTFDPSDPTNLSARWRRWIRAFQLYAAGKGIADAAQKKALLLHTAGMETQDIFFTLTLPDGEADEYAQAERALADHFTPQANVPYERHVFRRMAQNPSESVDQYVTRLRTQAEMCDFGEAANRNEQIRDQVIEKCLSQRLRRKLLERGAGLTLQQLLEAARVYEESERQANSMEGLSNSVNNISFSSTKQKKPHSASGYRHTGKPRPQDNTSHSQTVECYSCGNLGHRAKDPKCPALGQKCRKCQRIGHFQRKCRTKMRDKNRHRVQMVNEDKSDDEYCFSVSSQPLKGGISVKIGGIPTTMTVDTGATCNVIDRSTWEMLKKNKIKCISSKTEKKIFAYGSEKPLDVAGSFQTTIEYGEISLDNVEFLVFEGKGQSLLGRQTAIDLGTVTFDPDYVETVNAVDDKTRDYEQQYPGLFTGVGVYKDFQLKIPIDRSVPEVAQPLRRVPYHLREKLDNKLDELEEAGIIERCEGPSSWVSPLVCVPKANGEVRICVDMRRANEAVVRERHQIPTIEDVMQDLNKSTMFSKLDLRWGYHQIELDEESREITTFSTHRGLYRYKRLMFGISCAPEMYQKVVQQALNSCSGVKNIQDDIIVHGASQKEHDDRLNAVLNVLSEKGLTLNKEKCKFGVDKLVFMGHLLSDKGVGPTESKVADVLNAREPENAAEVKSFLGLVTYSSRFIPDFATVSAPLRELTKRNVEFVWGEEQRKSFDQLKKLLASADVLGYYDVEAETQVIADASPVGLGAVLVQKQQDEYRVICYASRALSDVERRYSQTEKEALALVWACERFHAYLFGTKFKLLTDHKPLEFIYSPRSKPSARIERWVLRLQPYDYTVCHIPGKQNIADSLSRLLIPSKGHSDERNVAEEYIRFVANEAVPCAVSIEELDRESEDDEELASIRTCMLSGAWHKLEYKEYLPVRTELSAVGNIVLRGTRILVPSSLRHRVLELAHEGHPGIVSMKRRLRVKVWWPHIDRDVELSCKSCHGCQIVSQVGKPEPMVRNDLPQGPWQDLAADLLGPLPSGDNILVVVDYYSRFFEIRIMKVTTSEKIISCMESIFTTHGLPLTLRTDNGPQFVSKEFELYLAENGIKHRKTTPLWPQANGEVEVQNRSIMKRIRIAQSQNIDWKDDLQKYLVMYRSTPHSTTGVSPAELLYNRPIRTKIPQLSDTVTADFEVRDRDSERKQKGKMYADKRRGARSNGIQAGDRVLVRQDKVNKFSTVFNKTPLTVLQKHGNSVLVEADSGAQYKRNVTFVKPYIEPQNTSCTHADLNLGSKGLNSDVVIEDSKVANGSDGEMRNESVEQEVKQDDQLVLRRSNRIRKTPKKLEDFVPK